MSTSLPRRLRNVNPDESAAIQLIRITEANGLPNVHVAARHLGITAVGAWEDESVRVIADFLKMDRDALRTVTPSFSGGQDAYLRGSGFMRKQVTKDQRRFCPLCLDEGSGHFSCNDVTVIASCVKHGVRLLHRCQCGAEIRFISAVLDTCPQCHHPLAVSRADVVSDFERAADRYIFGRLGYMSREPAPFADDIDLGDAIRLLERIGLISFGGNRKNAPNCYDLSKSSAELIAEGLRIVRDWDEEFSRTLDNLVEQGKGSLHAPGLQKNYGWVHDWQARLSDDPFRSEIKRAIAKHAAASFAIKRGTMSVDIETHPPQLFTLLEAAQLCGKSVSLMKRLCIALKLIPQTRERGGQFALPKEAIDEVERALRCSTNLKGVARELCIGKRLAKKVLQTGLLKPWMRAGTNGLNDHLFYRDDVEALLASMRRDADVVLTAPVATSPLTAACKTMNVDFVDACRFILAGELPPFGLLSGKSGLAGLLVDLDRLADLAHRKREWVSVEEAASILTIQPNTCRQLAKLGFIATNARLHTGKSHWRIDRTSLTEFSTNYAKGSEFAATLETSPRHCAKRLIALGARPIAPTEGGHRNAIFSRRDVERVLQGEPTRRSWSKEFRAEFWRDFGRLLQMRNSVFSLNYEPNQYVRFGTGRTGANILVRCPPTNLVTIRLELDSRIEREGFDRLFAERREIENELGFALEWNHPEAALPYAEITNREYRYSDVAKRPDLQNWMVDVMGLFKMVFGRRVRQLPGKPKSPGAGYGRRGAEQMLLPL